MTSLHADEAFLGFYQFSHDPFAPRVPGFKFFAAQRKPVLGQLHHLARYSQLLLVVSGPEGSGKTLLRQALVASTNKQSVLSVVVSARGAEDAASLLRQVAQGLGMQAADSRSIQSQVVQLGLTGQEVYLLVDDAEALKPDALEALLALAQGNADGRAHVFLFGEPSLIARLDELGDGGEECFHVIELQPYEEEETRAYLARRLEGAGQGIEVLSDDQIADIHAQSEGWPGAINQVARETLIEAMLAQRGSGKRAGFAFKLPKKHLLALVVVFVGVLAAWLMQGQGSKTPGDPAPGVVQAPQDQAAGTPAGQAQQGASQEGNPAVEFSGSSQPLPLPLVGEAQPVIRSPLAQAAATEDGDETAAEVPGPAPLPEPGAAAPIAAVPAPPVAAAPPVVTAPTASPAPVTQPKSTPPAAPAATKPAAPATAKLDKPAAVATAAAPGADWYRAQPATAFTVQILGSASESSAQAFVRANGDQYRYFKKVFQGKPLYVVTYGSFPSRTAAQAAIKTLPAKVQAGKPWPKTFASIQQEMGASR
ncbi:AAA family ATPase [Pseudomonas kuykendallii]|uniref:Type II secretion system protein A n=1 Tax=Pseudomonas kuykendallii TaxID=1007099 RepID=A0A1H2VRC3_9PSED|nr:AAA family ATPase [Pseudomonas kuykendallii]MCQ4273401.1 AAA family ATPase [Pseudomonas kuykendallii]SDW70850.1 type II secretion system protein A [Pseudomonas kuykendallii]